MYDLANAIVINMFKNGIHGNGIPSPHCGCGTWIFSTEHAVVQVV